MDNRSLSSPTTPETPLTNSLRIATSTVNDLTTAIANFSRIPSPEPSAALGCCCKQEECDNAKSWLALKSRLESRLILSAGACLHPLCPSRRLTCFPAQRLGKLYCKDMRRMFVNTRHVFRMVILFHHDAYSAANRAAPSTGGHALRYKRTLMMMMMTPKPTILEERKRGTQNSRICTRTTTTFVRCGTSRRSICFSILHPNV